MSELRFAAAAAAAAPIKSEGVPFFTSVTSAAPPPSVGVQTAKRGRPPYPLHPIHPINPLHFIRRSQKPYACKVPGCTKRYTDPSSLRKHVKTVHGAECYANKRHKGNHHDHEQQGEDGGSVCQPNTPRSVSTFKSELDNSPAAPLSSPEESAGNNGHPNPPPFHTASGLPLSDSNISTTNNGGGALAAADASPSMRLQHPGPPPPPSAAISTFCNLDDPEDINVSYWLTVVLSVSLTSWGKICRGWAG